MSRKRKGVACAGVDSREDSLKRPILHHAAAGDACQTCQHLRQQRLRDHDSLTNFSDASVMEHKESAATPFGLLDSHTEIVRAFAKALLFEFIKWHHFLRLQRNTKSDVSETSASQETLKKQGH